MELPVEGWATDVEVLRRGGSVVEHHGDHVVVATPRNPGYHWGNLVLVTDPAAGNDAHRWVQVFAEEFPQAEHVSVGLPGEPDPEPWIAEGLSVSAELVMARTQLPDVPPLPGGYRVRALESAADWALAVAADLAEGGADRADRADRADGADPEGGVGSYRSFLARRASVRSEMCDRGVAAFLGAFAPDGRLAAQAGMVLCGPLHGHAEVGRYQHVMTVPADRGHGLASHLLGVAGAWAAERGADLWHIHVDPGTDAHRLYERLGFGPVGLAWQAHRPPMR